MITINGKISYVNQVVGIRHESHDCGYDTIDYAIVWDWSQLKPIEICFYSSYSNENNGTCIIDADDITKKAYDIYLHNSHVAGRLHQIEIETTYQPKIGFMVEVVRGRLVSKGTIATITAIYETQYGLKCYMVDSNGNKYNTYIKNLEVIAVPINYYNIPKYKEYPKTSQILFGQKVS
jgi:hypothetical protein